MALSNSLAIDDIVDVVDVDPVGDIFRRELDRLTGTAGLFVLIVGGVIESGLSHVGDGVRCLR